MRSEYIALKSMIEHPGWKVLEGEWLAQMTKIQEARDRAAKRGNETAWRYWAGQEFGAKVMMMTAMVAMSRMEQENDSLKPDSEFDDLLKEVRGEKTI